MVLAHVAAATTIAVLFTRLGPQVGIFGLAAVLFGAFCFGLRGGLAAAAIQSALNAVVMQLIIDPVQPFDGPAMLGLLSYFVAGAVVGNQRDLSRKLRDELSRNDELRVREKETLAAIPDAMIRVGSDGMCRVQAEDVPCELGQILERVLGSPQTEERESAVSQLIALVRTTGLAQGLNLELPGAACYDIRCLPAANASLLVVVRDVTEQRKLLRRVTAAENLASIGTLAAGLAHEINNPLTYIITGVSSVGQSLGAGDASAKAELETALDGCWRIRDLVRDILETTTDRRQVVEPIFLTDVVETALTLVKAQVRHRATIQWEPDEVLYARAHRTKLVQVVVNLVSNASQAFLDNMASTNEIIVRAYQDGEWVVIEVKDNGPGMDETTRLRVLEPFFTTKAPGQGSGLGLFLCSSIIESFGGTLHIDSEVGRGTTVAVRLPLAEEAPPVSRVVCRELLTANASSPRLRVLVVDDEPEIRRALKRLLGQKHEVTMSDNGATALDRILGGERFDAILCDVLMPEMTGIELSAELERRFPDQAERVVFLTGGATSEAARVFIEDQRFRVLVKPFRPNEVEAAIAAFAPGSRQR